MTVLAQDAPQGNSQYRHSDPEEVIVSDVEVLAPVIDHLWSSEWGASP